MNNKLAVIFPGIGYHKDKPLLYYSAKLAQRSGYQIIHITFQDMPQKIRGDADMMHAAAELACAQAEQQLETVRWAAYDRILLIGKSIGTIAAARFAAEHPIAAAQIRYTPLHAAFTFAPALSGSCIAFLGSADPWSDAEEIKRDAAVQQIPLYLYPDCNHSLECGDVVRDIESLREIMQITSDFIRDTSS